MAIARGHHEQVSGGRGARSRSEQVAGRAKTADKRLLNGAGPFHFVRRISFCNIQQTAERRPPIDAAPRHFRGYDVFETFVDLPVSTTII